MPREKRLGWQKAAQGDAERVPGGGGNGRGRRWCGRRLRLRRRRRSFARYGCPAALDLWRRTTRDHGAITASVYSTDEDVLRRAEEIAWETGVALSENLTGGVFVNQSAAFSDFHATGANPAANACLTDPAFVSGRFRVVQSRHHIEPEPEEAIAGAATATP